MAKFSKETSTEPKAPSAKRGKVKRALKKVVPNVISGSESGVYTELQRRKENLGKKAGGFLLRAAIKADPDIEKEMQTGSHDSLTGFLNKRAFMEVLKNKMEVSEPVGLLFIDLDHFKLVNDRISHVQGDELLRRTSQFLFKSVRSEDELARTSTDDGLEYEFTRFGGDEFMVLVDLRNRNGEVNFGALEAIQDRIAKNTPEFIAGQPLGDTLKEIGFDISIGGAIPMPWEDPDALVERASLAMKADKAAHKEAA